MSSNSCYLGWAASRTASHAPNLTSSLSEAFPQSPSGSSTKQGTIPVESLVSRGDSKQRGDRWWRNSDAAAQRVDCVLAVGQIVTFALVIRRMSFLGFYD